MHYYSHNIADFNSATRHLTRVERSLYRDLIELYYDTEQPLDSVDTDRLARRVLAQSEEEKAALVYVLEEFFVDHLDVYRHIRCDEELDKYKANSSAKARAGKASAEARRYKLEAKVEHNSTPVEHPLNECSTNHKPITNNQELITNKQITSITKNTAIAVSDQPNQFEEFWKAYPKKSDKAKSKLAYAKAIKKASHELIIQSLFNQKNGNQWGSVQYTPMATTWLNGERWEDDLIPSGGFSNGTNKQQSTGGSSYDRQLAAAEETIAIYC